MRISDKPNYTRMTTQQLQQCKVCTKRKFNPSVGLVCGLTMEKPSFTGSCDQGDLDDAEALRLQRLNEAVEEEGDSNGFFAYEKKGMKKGVLGGVAMIVIAIVWFVLGLAADRIFYYPPILLIIGIVGVVKGLAEGNYSGK